uniref:Uncharacterized protein n=1 Tax=Ditylenchus dipsaci TaxID=166011 RepID=A0A915ELH4_9BILA
MKSTSQALQRLQTSLAIKLEAGKKVSENKKAFDDKYTEVDQKLEKVEGQLQQQINSDLDLKVLEQQLEQCNNLKSELRLTRTGINKLEDLGSRFVGGGGQSSRRSVHEAGADQVVLDQITQQLFGIRKRQEDAEHQLQDLIQKIAQSDEHLREHNQLMHLQKGSIQKLVGLQPADPQNKTVLAILHKDLAGYVIRRRDKQPEMAALRIKTQQLIGSLDEETQSGANNAVSSLYCQLNKQWNGLEENTTSWKSVVI